MRYMKRSDKLRVLELIFLAVAAPHLDGKKLGSLLSTPHGYMEFHQKYIYSLEATPPPRQVTREAIMGIRDDIDRNTFPDVINSKTREASLVDKILGIVSHETFNIKTHHLKAIKKCLELIHGNKVTIIEESISSSDYTKVRVLVEVGGTE